MDMILEQYLGTIELIDDVVVYGQTKKQHDQNFHNFMKVARCEGLCSNCVKYAVDLKEILFFRAVFSENGLHSDSHLMDEINTLLNSNNVLDLQKLLGIITFMTPFILRPYDLTAP